MDDWGSGSVTIVSQSGNDSGFVRPFLEATVGGQKAAVVMVTEKVCRWDGRAALLGVGVLKWARRR